MDLVPYIFHERQEPGSLLCAQHCLNNLVQQPVYTEIDLATLASELDHAESAARFRQPGSASYNYDDTGFFSIAVLEKALQVWDLELVRWRGEAMKQYQDRPDIQAAFILNLESHWFALRRFIDPTRWYNLNSFLEQPEWISPTYLQMVLKQAEEEGYSVFVVRKAGVLAPPGDGQASGWEDGGIAIMPECGADMMAMELGEVHNRGGAGAGAGAGAVAGATAGASQFGGPSASTQPVTISDPTPAEASRSSTLDAGAGSGRRRRRQEDPSSAHVEEQDLLPGSFPNSNNVSPFLAATRVTGIEGIPDTMLDEEIDEYDDLYEDVPGSYAAIAGSGVPGVPGGMPGVLLPDSDAYGGPVDFAFHHRSYDDEDEALQAALRASMEDVPEGYVMPELKPRESMPAQSAAQPEVVERPDPKLTAAFPMPAASESDSPPSNGDRPLSDGDGDDDIEEDDDDEPARELSPEEIRRARLARFQ